MMKNVHDIQMEEDEQRTREIENYGYRVIRFRNEEVEKDIGLVLGRILEECQLPSPKLGRRVGDEGLE